ncbi:MAG: chemotaxis protein CheW, partial [Leptospiraceae bacterium]|nr:chemotaxis protein CheW [Leptospiraceae bacterium]
SVLGVINLRGNVLPVVDLNLRLGREKTIITKRTCILHVEVEKEREKISLGLLVEKVNEVIELPEKDIEKTPDFGLKIRNDFVKGIGKISEGFVILLDVNSILSIEELSHVEIGANQVM